MMYPSPSPPRLSRGPMVESLLNRKIGGATQERRANPRDLKAYPWAPATSAGVTGSEGAER
jgi:hypothetical protein